MEDKNLRENKSPCVAAPFSECCDAPVIEVFDILYQVFYPKCSKCGKQVDCVGATLAD
jgi:hypothetical protein